MSTRRTLSKTLLLVISFWGLHAQAATGGGPGITSGIVFPGIGEGVAVNPAFLRMYRSVGALADYRPADSSTGSTGGYDVGGTFGNGKFGFGGLMSSGSANTQNYSMGVGYGQQNISFGVAYNSTRYDYSGYSGTGTVIAIGALWGQGQGVHKTLLVNAAGAPSSAKISFGLGFIEARHYQMEASIQLPSYAEVQAGSTSLTAIFGAAVYAKSFGLGFQAAHTYTSGSSVVTQSYASKISYSPIDILSAYVYYANSNVSFGATLEF